MAAELFFEDLAVGSRTVSPSRRVKPHEVANFLDFTGDWQNHWGSIFRPTPSTSDIADDPDQTPGLLLLGQQWGYENAGLPLLGIVATYRVQEIAHTAPLLVGHLYAVETEIVSLETLTEGFGNVLSRRRVITEEGKLCFSLIEKARFRTRDTWEAGEG